MNYKKIFLLLLLFAFIANANLHAQTPTLNTQAICSGNGATGGIIPSNNILSGQSAGETTLLGTSILIMLVVLMIVAILYMISYVMQLGLLKELAKAELGEIAITAIIIIILLGSFNVLASGVTSTPLFGSSGVNFGRNLYVDDCSYLSVTSISLIYPFLAINIVRFATNVVTSLQVNVEPSDFGFSLSPFSGYSLIDNSLGILDDITAIFIGLIFAVLFLLGIIYALFPLFLYAGIILRTLPWTRAAGGAFLGLFVGFFIVFPLLLHIILAGYISTAYGVLQNSSLNASTAKLTSGIYNNSNKVNELSEATFLERFLQNAYIFGTGNEYGLINGYIYAVIEPAALTFLAIIVSFMISFDFAEAMGDLLGAPSLRSSHIFNKLL